MIRRESRRDHRCGLSRGDNRNDLEVDDVVPVRHPLIEEVAVVTFHDLIAALQVLGDPASPILDPFRHQASSIAETPVHRNGISIPKVFDNQIEHASSVG
jgi:hypothetical protein